MRPSRSAQAYFGCRNGENGVRTSLSSESLLIAAPLIAVIIPGILYESYILPLTILSTLPSADVDRLLMLFHTDLSVIAMIGMSLLIGIVKKNGIMLVDFAVSAERRDGLLLSQVLTLYTTPVIYLYLDRLQHWLTPRHRSRMPTLASKMGAGAPG